MENRLYLYNLGIKTFGGFATLGGVIQALQLFTQPDLDIKSILLSFPAWVVYVFVCLTIIFAMLILVAVIYFYFKRKKWY